MFGPKVQVRKDTDFDQGTWMSLLDLLHPIEFFVPFDQTTLWRRHVACTLKFLLLSFWMVMVSYDECNIAHDFCFVDSLSPYLHLQHRGKTKRKGNPRVRRSEIFFQYGFPLATARHKYGDTDEFF